VHLVELHQRNLIWDLVEPVTDESHFDREFAVLPTVVKEQNRGGLPEAEIIIILRFEEGERGRGALRQDPIPVGFGQREVNLSFLEEGVNIFVLGVEMVDF
jgi:hypothetical protein